MFFFLFALKRNIYAVCWNSQVHLSRRRCHRPTENGNGFTTRVEHDSASFHSYCYYVGLLTMSASQNDRQDNNYSTLFFFYSFDCRRKDVCPFIIRFLCIKFLSSHSWTIFFLHPIYKNKDILAIKYYCYYYYHLALR